jgi:hypothetical protein
MMQASENLMTEVIRVTVRLFLSYTGQSTLSDVIINIDVPSFVSIPEPSISVPALRSVGVYRN